MDPLQPWNFSFPKIVLPCPESRKRVPRRIQQEESEIESISAVDSIDYTLEYIQKEERELLESTFSEDKRAGEHNYEEVSQGQTPSLDDVKNTALTKIYKTYNFAYRSKANMSITSAKDKIISMIETNPVVVIQGPTGCGKTTQVPQYILDSCYRKKVHCNIIVTQPRRIAAISIAKRVSDERDWPVGTLVGYQVGMINNTSADTRLTYCTTGVLLQKLISKKNMLEYTHVILDEVHERDQEMDFLLLIVRKLLRTNSRTVKVVLMSATFNVDKFSKYFSSPVQNKLVPAPIVDVAKRNYFQVNLFYLCQIEGLGSKPEVSLTNPRITTEMLDFSIRMIIIFDGMDKKADNAKFDDNGLYQRHVVLIFLPGINEIEEMYNLLTLPKNESLKWDIVVLHSSLSSEEQQKIFDKPPAGYRRIILSTNIAESSITVPDVKYVIDFCLTKHLITDPATNFQCLELSWASKTNCEQRAGRTGRVMDGIVYRLVPKLFYEDVLSNETPPEIQRAPLANVILQTKLLDMGEPKAILALSIDPPDLSNLERTILLLKEAGALLRGKETLEPFDGELTELGYVMAKLPLNIQFSKLIMLGHVFSVLRESIIIAASMTVRDIFSNPFQRKLEAYNIRCLWSHNSNSDCISFLNVYKVWLNQKANRNIRNNEKEKSWARRHFIQLRPLREVEALVQDLTSRLKRLGIVETFGVNKVVWSDTHRPTILKIVLAGAFYPNYFMGLKRNTVGDESLMIKEVGGLDPKKTVYLQDWPLKQPGMLYARRIQEFFQEHCSQSKISVSFNSTRVFVQFDKNEHAVDDTTDYSKKLSPSIYKAVKMRQCKIAVNVPVLDARSSHRKAEEMNLTENTFTVLTNQNLEEQEKKEVLPCTRPQLPSLDMSYIPIKISQLIDPAHFWARTDDGDTENIMKMLGAKINNLLPQCKKFETAPEVGTVVLAPQFAGDKIALYHRAKIQAYTKTDPSQRNETVATVLFIDIGRIGTVRLCDLRSIKKNSSILKIPALTFECVLTEVELCTMRDFTGELIKRACKEFCELTYDAKLFGEVYSVVNSVVSINLIRVQNDNKLSINEYLIAKGFAKKKSENYFSRYNHDLRQKHCELKKFDKHFKRYEEMQYDQCYLWNEYPHSPPESECSDILSLRGPFSPLEIKAVNMTNAGKGKIVNIDPNSVNSVLLDDDPEGEEIPFLVSATISQSPVTSNLTARHTTLLPKIPGLIPLICLIFTPHMELRRNDMGTYYVGALCGLGYDSEKRRSIFPEHDMEVHFDVEITLDDLQDINRLRHWMNIGMHTSDEIETANIEEVIICQNRVKDMLLKLINKDRKPQKIETINGFGKWNKYEQSYFLKPGEVSMMRHAAFELHNALELEERNEELEQMIEHAMELRNFLSEDIRKTKTIDINCKFCNKTIYGAMNLRRHIFTSEHEQNEERCGVLNKFLY